MELKELQVALLSECAPYIKELRECTPGDILLRGYEGHVDLAKKFKHNLKSRKPRDTPQNTHDLVNTFFEEKFGWKIRNGVFCYGFNLRNADWPESLGYGPFYICFPVGNFKLVYSPTVMDLYGHINNSAKAVEETIYSMDFEDESLCKAIESGDRNNQNVSNEISICTESYYLIDFKYKDWVYSLIWK